MERLYKKLESYGQSDYYPFHMPGHKRNRASSADDFLFERDITEISGFDNLHHAEGILKEAQEYAAQIYGTKKCFFSVNGSTAALLAAVSASVNKGGKILVARNCHKAVYHALYLRELQPVYIYPHEDQRLGINGGISPERVERYLEENTDVQAFLLTSPTYDGVVSDIKTIAEVVHRHKIPLIVDEAHGAHLHYSKYFPVSAADLGADIVIQSFHKTLPSMTQTAVLHICSDMADVEKIKRFMGIYQTSSPSYILMASMDACMDKLRKDGQQMFREFTFNLEKARQRLSKCEKIKLIEGSMIEVELPVSAEDQEVSVKTEKIRLMSLRVHKKDTLRIKDDITLASNRPNVENLLWYMAEPRNLDLRPGENKLRVKGELAVFLLYTGYEEENPPQWLEYTMPFSNEMECSGCMEDLIPHIEVSLLHQGIEVKPDPDGEERILQVDVVLELNMKMYREEEHELLLDVYSPHKECVLHRKKEMLESLLVRNFSRCRLTDRIEVKESQGKVLQLCHSSGKVKVDKTRITDKGIVAEGIVALKILYIIGNDEMPFYSMDAMLPFTHLIEAEEIGKECTYLLQADLEQLSTAMADGDEIEVKAAVGLNVLVFRQWEEQLIESVEEQPLDRKKLESMPGITVYIVKAGDTLWDIAKKFYTTVDEISGVNSLTEKEVKPGQSLILVRQG